MSNEKFEVQTLIGGTWENVWKEEVEGEDAVPITYESEQEAKEALAEHKEDLEDADMEFDASEFRIVPVKAEPSKKMTP